MNLETDILAGSLLRTGHSVFILAVLLACSFVCVAFIIERWLYFRRLQVKPEDILLKIRASVLGGRAGEALSLLGPVDENPVLAVIRAGIVNSHLGLAQVGELLRVSQIRQRASLERHLGVLGTLGNTAPFIGLLGTVMGIVQAFRDLAAPAVQAGGGAGVVATGISEALVATAAGLLVAIPAVMFYNYFLKKAKQIMLDMEIASGEMMVLLALRGTEEASK